MTISSSAYFAVESLARLAACGPDRPCPTESLARSINRSVSFTVQLMTELHAAGLVKATRGPRRGYYLNKPAHRITVAEVFRAFGEPHTLKDRPFAPRDLSDSEIDELGGTHLLWEALNGYSLLFLEGVSPAATDEGRQIVWATGFIDRVERASRPDPHRPGRDGDAPSRFGASGGFDG